MLTGRVAIERVRAHCLAETETLRARLRLAHLLQSADIAPRSVSPHAILLVRRAFVRNRISLASFRLLPEWEQEAREILTEQYHLAVRPVRGRIPADAQAVLFEDMGEWLACLGLAVQARSVERTWYWRDSLHKDVISTSLALARAWVSAPRYVPAAITYLAEWGHAADILQLFSPQESNMVFTAMAKEWGVTKHELPATDSTLTNIKESAESTFGLSLTRVASRAGEFDQQAATVANERAEVGSTIRTGSKALAESKPEPPWRRWLSQAEPSYERLPLQKQRFLAIATTLFHAPAYARSASFTIEVSRWLHWVAERQGSTMRLSGNTDIRIAPSKVGNEIRTSEPTNHSSIKARDARRPSACALMNEHHLSAPTRAPEILAVVAKESKDEAGEQARNRIEEGWQPPRHDLARHWTEIGGVLFLLNLLQQTELPECFDQGLSLSEHISGWGLAEMLAKALLGPLNEAFRQDPLWPILASLDGRAHGEIPAMNLPDVDAYRIPARWLKRFDGCEQSWEIDEAVDRLKLRHCSGDFIIVNCPLETKSIQEQATIELERYRMQGINARLVKRANDSSASVLNGMGETEATTREERLFRPGSISWQFIPEWTELPRSLRRCMYWTFPFLRHLLMQVLGEEARSPDELARQLLIKAGMLYCTATHVDLLMTIDQISLPVRRAGLDVNPGWLRDLMRVVSFYFE